VPNGDAQAKAAYDAEQKKAIEVGSDLLKQLTDIATSGDVDAFQHFTAALKPSSGSVGRLPRRIIVGLVYCRNCYGGHLVPSILNGQGKKIQRTRLPATPVPKEVVMSAIS
jgi:hypothetical protein